jgi:hypothetical protein
MDDLRSSAAPLTARSHSATEAGVLDDPVIPNVGVVGAEPLAAEKVLTDAANAYRAALGERLLAAYALGSLAHGGFSPLVSDIDVGLIVSDPTDARDANTIRTVADEEKVNGSELCQRLSVFWGTPSTLRGEQEGGRFPPLDRLDLIENGRLLLGTDARGGLTRPTAGELIVTGAEFALEFLAGMQTPTTGSDGTLGSMHPASASAVEEIRDPDLLVARGVRRLTKLVLFPVRFLYTAAAGRVGTNEHAVAWYLDQNAAPARVLVADALGWRRGAPVDATAAAALMRDNMEALYVHYIDDHVGRLRSLARSDLADMFEEWRSRLTAEDR